jgi:ribosomal protein S18 acetylase RimI-like enzyme
VAESGGRIAGALYIHLDQLFYLVVDEEYRRQGIARLLLVRGKRPRRWCRVAPSNKPIISLLESEGFVYDPYRLTDGTWHAYIWRMV